MKSFFSFIRSRQFLINFSIILVIIVAGFYGVIRWLASYTGHGEFVTVPDFTNQRIADLDTFVKGKFVGYEIIDSIYDPKEKPGIVLRQDPEPQVKVKDNRTVYLYVTGMVAPQVLMPKLVDRSERQARLILRSYDLKPGKTTVKAADCEGCVLEQLVRGKPVEQGTPVKKGTVVELVIGTKDPFFRPDSISDSDTQ